MIALLLLAAQAAAGQGAWTVADGRATVTAAGIGLPARAGALSLTSTGEASRKGDGVDDVAQYLSADGRVFATAYVFRAAYADTALASWKIGRIVAARYGPKVRLAEERAVAAGDHERTLLRARYEGAVAEGHAIATLSGFVRASSWLVGLRVSGPADRRAEVEAAFDALAAGLTFAPGLHVYTATPLVVEGACPPASDAVAKPLGRGKSAGAQVLAATMMGGSLLADLPDKAGKPQPPLPPAFPANGAQHACVRGVVRWGKNQVELLQPAGDQDPAIVLGVLDDAGGTFTIERTPIDKGYLFQTYGVAVKEVRGGFDRMPSLAQLEALANGTDRVGAAVRARMTMKAQGGSDITIDSAALE